MEKNKIMQLLLPALAGAAILGLILFLMIGPNKADEAKKLEPLPNPGGVIPEGQETKDLSSDAMSKELPDIKEDGYTTMSTGLKFKDIKIGDGTNCPEGATVTCHYAGWQTDGKMFDSSYLKRGSPATFSLFRVITGWKFGMPGMKPGGIRRLIIPKEMAYGDGDSQQPGGTLVFEIKLIRWR
jgi:FKBP-type peptidyl-prolyl cis-trans isomerase